MKKNKRIRGSELIGFLSFLMLWEILYLSLKTHTVPSPMATILYMVQDIDKLILHCFSSIGRVMMALLISLILGIPIGILLGVNISVKKVFGPLLYFIYPIPKVAFLPVFMLLFGLGNTSKIILVIWIIIFQIILSVRDGVEQIPQLYFKIMDSYCVTEKQKYQYLILPAILPQLFTGIRISIGISLASLFFAENYATKYGIGYYILSAWTKMNYVEMFSGILALGLIGILLYKILDALELICAPWTKQKF